jgi:AcrR family transcriptional regulator
VSPELAGLRERKKQRTRETIIRVAIDLFAQRGFEETTVADIAAAADIAPRTFFGYFATKEDVVFHDLDAMFASLSARLQERAPHETAFDVMRAWLIDWIETTHVTDPAESERRRLIRGTPALAARERSNLARFEGLLADAVAPDLGVPADSLRPHLVAAAAVAALDALGRFYEDRTVPPAEKATAIMDEAIVFLGGGLEALRRRPPA